MDKASLIFYLLATLLVLASLLVVFLRNVVHCAMALVTALLLIAVLFVTLHAPMVGVLQVMVYAGAIMVLIVFTIMLLNIRVNATQKHSHKVLLGSIIGVFTLINSVVLLVKSQAAKPVGPYSADMIKNIGHSELIGREMFTTFLLPFEITSILLLVAMVGAVILAKKKL